MDKQPVGQLPDLTQSNNDDEIMVITNSEYNQLKKEKISDFITDLTSTNENNALTKGTDGKMFVTDFGNASNITEGTLPVSVLPDIPKDKLPQIETADLPNSGVTAGKYIYPTNMQVNSKGQIVSVENGVTADITKEQIDIVTARKLTTSEYTQEQYPDEYSYWVDQAHSTFDLSKFEVVGSPTISADGIASGFSGSNYIKGTVSIDWSKPFIFKIACTTPKSIFANFTSLTGIDLVAPVIRLVDTKWSLRTIDGTVTDTENIEFDKKYWLKLIGTNSGITFLKSTDGINYVTIGTTSANSNTTPSIPYFGIYRTTDARAWEGSIDLKSIHIFGDGQPVFSGNKTAIDTIKAPDYTVVGSPTISADGIASGFSASNYLTKALSTDFLNSDFDMIIPVGVTTPGSDTGNSIKLMNGPKMVARAYVNSIGYLFTLYYLDNSIVVNSANLIPTANLTPNTINYIRVTRVNNTINYYGYYNNKWNLRTSSTVADGKSFDTNFEVYIGAQRNGENPLSSYTDLNSIKFYSNRSLIYQPCLYIPYTETTDGTKIVDAAYFDRVQSCCEQTGQALYLTLDEQNQQYYLPQGTVSGMISQNKQKIDELDTTLTADILQAMPVGASIAYEGTTAPESWFAENGLEVQKSEYPKLYAVVGDKYNLETTQEGYFRLPDTNVSSRFYEGSTTPGTLKDAGLPNITGHFNADQLYNGGGYGDGAFGYGGATGYPTPNSGSDASQSGFYFNASRSSSVYGKSTTVQPKSITKFFIIKHD